MCTIEKNVPIETFQLLKFTSSRQGPYKESMKATYRLKFNFAFVLLNYINSTQCKSGGLIGGTRITSGFNTALTNSQSYRILLQLIPQFYFTLLQYLVFPKFNQVLTGKNYQFRIDFKEFIDFRSQDFHRQLNKEGP